MAKLWACYEPDLIQYHEDRAAALSIGSEDVSASLKLIMGEAKEEILSIEGNTAQIRIEGLLTQNGPDLLSQILGISGTSYRAISEAIAEANEDPEVEQIVFAMNTPGGEVNGLDAVYQAVAGSAKPVVAINMGLIASAGYWIAVAADKILADSAIVETGSIGIVVSGIDRTEQLAREGIRVVDIVSENAPNKAPKVSTDEGVEELRTRINAIERVFISRVAMGRGVSEEQVKSDFGRGSVLIADDPSNANDALSVGMIDGILYTPQSKQANTNIAAVSAIDEDAAKIEGDTMAEENTIEASAELDALKADHAGLQARIERATPYLSSTEYPATIKAIALKVINGEIGADSLDSAVSVYDALKETKVSNAAVADSAEIAEPVTTPIDVPQLSDDGVIRNELDYKATMDRIRSKRGIVR